MLLTKTKNLGIASKFPRNKPSGDEVGHLTVPEDPEPGNTSRVVLKGRRSRLLQDGIFLHDGRLPYDLERSESAAFQAKTGLHLLLLSVWATT